MKQTIINFLIDHMNERLIVNASIAAGAILLVLIGFALAGKSDTARRVRQR